MTGGMATTRPGAVRIEEIMTPRSILVGVPVERASDAARLAEHHDFEAIPILRDCNIIGFWSRSSGGTKRIVADHRVDHSEDVERVLRRLAQHVIQFVHYRGQIVGLVDLSDLNRPIARLVFLTPMLECEQAIHLAVRARQLSEDRVREALGGHASRAADRRRRAAARQDLNAPLLEFALFSEVLRAAVNLELASIGQEELKLLSDLRNRSAHAARTLVERQTDTADLIRALELCRRITKALTGRVRISAARNPGAPGIGSRRTPRRPAARA
jgi:hypothetical protein